MSSTDLGSLADPAEVRLAEGEAPPESRGTGVWDDIRHAFRLAKQYFGADPWVGTALLVGKIGLGGLGSYAAITAQLNVAAITTALSERNGAPIPQLLLFAVLAMLGGTLGMLLADWVEFVLRMRSRTRLTQTLTARWLDHNRYYRLERATEIDHPEQRIQEDIYIFVDQMINIVPGLIGTLFPLFLYSGKLWSMSPPISPDGIGLPVVVHGLMFYITVGFAVLWTFVTHWLGRSLTTAEITRQGLEAQFRQEMGAIRENGEAIAFQKGAAFEGARLAGTFDLIRKNWTRYTLANLRVTFATGFPTVLYMLAPFAICAPFVLDGRMKLGDIQFMSGAMVGVYGAVGVFIGAYRGLAILRSAVSRLRYFEELLDAVPIHGDIAVHPAAAPVYAAHGVTLAYPDGRPMIAVGDLTIPKGDRVLIKGPSGAGKSTFLRALADLWPHGSGSIAAPEAATVYFMPQRAYMPDGTLAALMAYPRDPADIADETYRALLDRLDLAALAPRLHDYAPWKRRLSPGEQQRIAAARAVLNAPDFLFVDEATSALDLRSEETFYTLLAEQLPDAAIISVAHRPTVERYHDRIVDFSGGKATETRRDRSDGPAA